MGLFSKIFGSDSHIKKGFDLIDEAFHTSQEKAEDVRKVISQKIDLLKAYEAFKIAQRFLAVIYSVPYVLAWFITFCVSFISEVDRQIELLSGDIGMINLIIISFYFGCGAIEGVIKRYNLGRKSK